MKTSKPEADRIVWFLHPFREMKVSAVGKTYTFLLQGFQMEFLPNSVNLYLSLDIGKKLAFADLFPIFEENLDDLRKEELIEVVHSPDETDGLVIKIKGDFKVFTFNPFNIVAEILCRRWQIGGIKALEYYRYATMFSNFMQVPKKVFETARFKVN